MHSPRDSERSVDADCLQCPLLGQIGSLSNRQRSIYDTVVAPALVGLALEERRGAPLKAA